MYKRFYYVGFILFVIFFLFTLYYRAFFKEQIKLTQAISNAKSMVVLYALDSNKTNIAKQILKDDMVQLIYDYDGELYSKSRVLNTICKNWQIYKEKAIIEYLDNGNINANTDYYNKVKLNSITLDNKCIND